MDRLMIQENKCSFSREENSNGVLGVITDPEFDVTRDYFGGCVIVAMLFGIATFTVYFVIPELKNFQGLMFRCYLASYIACLIPISTLWIFEDCISSKKFIVIHCIGICYFGAASMLWLNVMSFDIWRTFRSIKVSDNVNIKKRQTAKFRRYSIYVWSVPAILVFFCWFLINLLVHEFITLDILTYVIVSPFALIAICNSCFYVSTALNIRKLKKETAHLIGGLNKHSQEDEVWFKLYVKLFMLMGGTATIWIAAVYTQKSFSIFVYLAEALHSMFIFVLFVCKKDVRLSIQERLNESLRRFGSCLRRNSTPNRNELMSRNKTFVTAIKIRV